MGGYACLQNKRREGNGAGAEERVGRSGKKRETMHPERGREYAHQEIYKRRTHSLKHLATVITFQPKQNSLKSRQKKCWGRLVCTELTQTLPAVKYPTGKKVVQSKIYSQRILQGLAPRGTTCRQQPSGALPDSAEHMPASDIKDKLNCRHNQICTLRFFICPQQAAIILLLQHKMFMKIKVLSIHLDMCCKEGYFWIWNSKLCICGQWYFPNAFTAGVLDLLGLVHNSQLYKSLWHFFLWQVYGTIGKEKSSRKTERGKMKMRA